MVKISNMLYVLCHNKKKLNGLILSEAFIMNFELPKGGSIRYNGFLLFSRKCYVNLVEYTLGNVDHKSIEEFVNLRF